MSLSLRGQRRGGLQRLQADYLCLHCEADRWTAGGLTALANHLTEVHRHRDSNGDPVRFPDAQRIDETHQLIDWEGNPVRVNRQRVPATRDGDGWIMTRHQVSAHSFVEGS